MAELHKQKPESCKEFMKWRAGARSRPLRGQSEDWATIATKAYKATNARETAN